MVDIDGFRFGIEHEYPVVDAQGQFCDFSNSTFEAFVRTLDPLPIYSEDYDSLRVGDLGIKKKRWYIEGFERFSAEGEYLYTVPKGFEIRTPIQPSIERAVEVLEADLRVWEREARNWGYRAILTSLNPFRREFIPDPPLNEFEVGQRQSPEEQTAYIHMLTYGPDVSMSHPELGTEGAIELGKKLTYYSPFIVPFSYSSPFYDGKAWGGYSRRTYYRTGMRPSALVFVGDESAIMPSFPTLTDRARIPAEVGRVEFKAFDCPRDVRAFRALGTLLLGLALDETLPGRVMVPDAEAHQLSATRAFDDPGVFAGASEVLAAARRALPAGMRSELDPLGEMLEKRETPAHAMLARYEETGSILAALEPK